MAFTQEQLDALETAIATGTTSVKYEDKVVTYRSLTEMLQLRDLIRRKLNSTNTKSYILTTHTKGIDA